MPARATRRTSAAFAVGLAGALLMASCGDESPTAPSTGSATITFSATGVTPTEVRIPAGGRVTFVNNDTRSHDVSSDPITVHTDCPPINAVGTVTPGQSRNTGVLNVVRTCGFHDHTNETDPRWKGRIVVE